MSDWSSFNEDKKRTDAWKKYLTERDTGKYNFDPTTTQQTKRKGTPPKGRVLLSNVLVSLEKDGLVSADQAGKIHDLIRKAVVAKHGRQFFDQTMGENINLPALGQLSISKPQRRGPATTRRRLDSIDLTSVGISKANQREVAKRLNNLMTALDMEVIVGDVAAAAVADEPAINKVPKVKPVSDAIQAVAYDNIITFKEAGQLLSKIMANLAKQGYNLQNVFEELQLDEGLFDKIKGVFGGVAPIQAPKTAKATAGVKRRSAGTSVIAQKVAQQDTSKLKKAQDDINKLLAPFSVMVKFVSTQLPKGGKAPGIGDRMRQPDDVAPPLEESIKRMSKLAGIVKG